MHADRELSLTSTYHPCSQVAGILRGHVAAALTTLSSSKLSASKIHTARQELKRARAALRLLRGSIEPGDFREEDTTLRQAAGQLNRARDSEVLWRVFSRLRASIKEGASRGKLAPLSNLLLQERQSATSDALRAPMSNVRTLLAQAKEQTRDWHVANDLDLLTTAMQRTYRKGRACYRAACQSHSDEHLHAWRRQVKYSAYQLETVGSLAPARMTKRMRRCVKLARVLGRDHDLSLLHQRVAEADLDAACTLHLEQAIRHERSKLQRQALRLGERLYRVKPRQFQPLNYDALLSG